MKLTITRYVHVHMPVQVQISTNKTNVCVEERFKECIVL